MIPMHCISKARVLISVIALVTAGAVAPAAAATFESQWDQANDRVWIGPEYWANPMEDFRLANGRLECLRGGPNRNVHLLTYRLGEKRGGFTVTVRLGDLTRGRKPGTAGFALGVLDQETKNPQSSLLFGTGLPAGITTTGELFIGNPPEVSENGATQPLNDIELRLVAQPDGDGTYTLELSACDADGKQLKRIEKRGVQADRLVGNIALMNNFAENRRPNVPGPGRFARFWFADWKVSGDKVIEDESLRFGPILYAMYTLSRGVMKMTAQMPPLGERDNQTVQLQIRDRDGGDWKTMGEATIDPLARTATFRIENWDDRRDVPYRLVYRQLDRSGNGTDTYFTGIVRKDPVDQEEIVVAGFTGNTDAGFPNVLVATNVAVMNPDLLFFSGDQIYEGVGGYGIHREPVDLATLNYLRKIYLWGWAFRDLMRDRPTLVLPDDHDVYQGNLWGENGRDCGGIEGHDSGGYAMPPEWVNMIERTQTSHLPDPYDPTPVERGIGVYYCDMLYGRISIAVIEDRKFKSGPAGKVNYWEGRPDHVKDPNFDPKSVDKPGLQLLGDRQLKFLRAWAADWKGADLKMVVSQTIFCNLANYHGQRQEYLVADLDSNGWPQSGRNEALDVMRRGLAFHYAGDQHLASIVHHGIDEFRDADFSFCVPSIAAGYPRSWRADAEGRPVRNRPEPGLPDTGDYFDGLGNRMTVYAVGNPAKENRSGRIPTLHDKASGFGIVRLNKPKGTITMECYRLQVDANNLKPEDQFPGWPRTIHYTENDGRRGVAHLPTLRINGIKDPVVQVVREGGAGKDDEVLYTLRIRGQEYQPRVFAKEGTYTVHVSDPDRGMKQTLRGLQPREEQREIVEVQF